MADLGDEPDPAPSRAAGSPGSTSGPASRAGPDGPTARSHRRLVSPVAAVLLAAAALGVAVVLAREPTAVPELASAEDTGPTAERSYYAEPPPTVNPPVPAAPRPSVGANPIAEPAYAACEDPAGDSSGDPDLVAVAMDRPAYPFWHYHWDGSRLPADGVAEMLLSATSADGSTSRELMVVLRDRVPEGQYVRDPETGDVVWLHPDRETDAHGSDGALMRAVDLDPTGNAVGASFPAALMAPLGTGWAWTASVTVDGTLVDVCDEPIPPATRPSATATPTTMATPVPVGWGPEVPHFATGGRPMAGAEPWPGEARVRTMTEVSTGVVYVDPSTDEVVHRGWDDKVTVIGTTPWQRGVVDGEVLPPEKVGGIWGDYRELVGNPSHDLVAWVDSVDGARGDLVVVRASTGEEMARTPVPGDRDRDVIIASVDSEAAYFTTLAPGMIPASVPGGNVWTWRWSVGEPPEDARDIADVIIDVSSGVWAVYGPRGVQFQDDAGRVLSTTDGDPGDRAYFGHTFSPDGRFWRGGSGTVTVVATGEEVLGPTLDPRTAWSDVDELASLDGNQLTVCTYPSGACSPSIDVPLYGQVDMPTF